LQKKTPGVFETPGVFFQGLSGGEKSDKIARTIRFARRLEMDTIWRTTVWPQFGAAIVLYNMRHVQEHAAQLNLILGQNRIFVPDWVTRARSSHSGK
jgi:hypothetical protein